MLLEETVVRPYELRAQSAKSLLRRLYRELSTLIGQEAELAKVEIRDRGGSALSALRTFAVASAVALVAAGCLATAAIAGLSLVIPVWLSAIAAGAVFAVVAVVLAASARGRMRGAAEPMRSAAGSLLEPGDATADEIHARIESAREQARRTIDALEGKGDLLAPIRDTALGLGSLAVAIGSIARSDDRG
jgi:Putative Actinobacterial Holin-X, holin superfamily III